MKHLQKISQFMYFQLMSIFLLLMYLFQAYPDVVTQSFIYVFFTLLLVPIIDKIVSGVFFEMNVSKYLNLHFFIGCVMIALSIVLLIITDYFSILTLLLLSLVFTWYYKIDGRVYFLLALFVFLYVILSLLLGNQSLAEGLSIGAYYLLIAGVVGQIIENISLPKGGSHA